MVIQLALKSSFVDSPGWGKVHNFVKHDYMKAIANDCILLIYTLNIVPTFWSLACIKSESLIFEKYIEHFLGNLQS